MEDQKGVMDETSLLECLTHLAEIVNDAINGIVAFLLYWPLVWLFFHYDTVSKTPVLDLFGSSYAQLAGIGAASWIGILLAVPFIGLLNRAINHTFVSTPQKYIGTIPLICKLQLFIRLITMKTIRKQFDFLLEEKDLLKLDDLLTPCWKLQGCFDFVNYRHWIIASPSRKSYWDWEHFLDWVYKMYYQTFFLFLNLYLVLLIITAVRFGLQSFLTMNISSLIVFLLVLPTYALYREYLVHHVAWIRMDQKFYAEYLIEEKEYMANTTKKNLRSYLEEENYEKVEETLREYFKHTPKQNSISCATASKEKK